MWGNRVVCYDVSLFTNEFHFSSLLYQLYYFGSIKLQFSLRAHQRRFSSFFFQSIQLNLAGPVCSASHQNLTKFWLALPIDAWGLVFVKVECDHQPIADFLWLPQICWDSGEINFLVAPFPPPLFKVFPIIHTYYVLSKNSKQLFIFLSHSQHSPSDYSHSQTTSNLRLLPNYSHSYYPIWRLVSEYSQTTPILTTPFEGYQSQNTLSF